MLENFIKTIMLIFVLVFIKIIPTFADIIGCDVDGIVCLDDNFDMYSNEFRTLDLDFDGRYELYYFDVNGRLKTNNFINNYYLNEKGQRTDGGNVSTVDIEPNGIKVYQIDNLDYYYINKVKSKFNENWDIQSRVEEKKRAKVNIDIPEMAGNNKSIVSKINHQLNTRGLELLKVYVKDEVYKRNASKLSITIEKFIRDDVQKLCFIPMLNDKFYFNFDINIELDNKNKIYKNIGLCVDTETCIITNWDLKSLNNKYYQNEEYIKTSDTNSYISKYKEYVENLENEYVDSLIDYIDRYEDYISEYENKIEDTNQKIKAINNYIKNIDSVYNTYTKIAKKAYQNNEIDEETYKYIIEDFKEPLAKYKEKLNNNLQVDINALKELELDKG